MSWQTQGRQGHGYFGHGTAVGLTPASSIAPMNGATHADPMDPTSVFTDGRYVASDPMGWVGQASVGTGECVPLVREATGAPRSAEWTKGGKVQGNFYIKPGTAIATFDSKGN